MEGVVARTPGAPGTGAVGGGGPADPNVPCTRRMECAPPAKAPQEDAFAFAACRLARVPVTIARTSAATAFIAGESARRANAIAPLPNAIASLRKGWGGMRNGLGARKRPGCDASSRGGK